jgi:hypothetical protein
MSFAGREAFDYIGQRGKSRDGHAGQPRATGAGFAV